MLTHKKNWFYNQHFIMLLLLNVVFFITAAYVLPIRFEENDDVMMLLFASGKYTGTPEENLVFINFLYGEILKLLYTWNNQIEWYAVLFAGFHIISLSVISWFIIKNEKVLGLYKILFLILFYVIEIRLILLFQFTTTAAVCAVAGLLLVFNVYKKKQLFGIALFVLAGLIRFEVACLILLILCPLFIRTLVLEKKLFLSSQFISVAIAASLVFLFKFVDYQNYQQQNDWKYYQVYNEARGKINDNPRSAQIKEIPGSVSAADYQLLLNFFPDGKVLDLNKLNLIKNELAQYKFTNDVSNLWISLKNSYAVITLLLILIAFVIAITDNKKNGYILPLALIIFLFCLYFIITFGSIKQRVLLTAVLGLLPVIYISLENVKKVRIHPVFVSALLLFTFLFAKQNIFTMKNTMEARAMDFVKQEVLIDNYLQNPLHKIIPFAGNYSIQLYNPFNISKKFKQGRIYFGGWLTNLPYNKEKFESYMDIIDKHSIFFKKDSYKHFSDLLIKSIDLNYGVKVYPVIESECKDYLIVRLIKIK